MKEEKYGSMSKKRAIGNAISYILLILISIIWLFPFFGLIMQSFRSYSSEYGGMVNYIIPKKFSLDNYRFLMSGETNYLLWYRNTVIIAVIVAILQTIIILCVSYALSRMRFKGREMSHVAIGQEVMAKFIEECRDLGASDKAPVLDGRFMSITLTPLKFKSN